MTTNLFYLMVEIWRQLHRFLLRKANLKAHPPKLTSIVQALSNCTRVDWVELTLWIRFSQHIED